MSEQILTPKDVHDLIFVATMGLDEVKTFGLKLEIEAAFEKIEASHNLLDQKYRLTLWLQHGCPIAQAFDDTTMRCGGRHEFPDDARFKPHGPLDFRQDTILDLETELAKMKLVESGMKVPNLNDEPWRWALPVRVADEQYADPGVDWLRKA